MGLFFRKYVLVAISMSTYCKKLYSERRSNPVTDGKEVCCAKKPFKSHLTCGKFGKGYVNRPSTVYDPPPLPPFTLSPSPHPLPPSPYPLHPIPLPTSPYPHSPYSLHPIPLHPTLFTLPPSPYPLHSTPFPLPPSPYPPSPYPLHPIILHPIPLHPIPLHPIPLHPTPFTLTSPPYPPPTLTSKHSEVPPLIIKKIHYNFAPCKFVIARTFFYGLPCS